MSNKINTLADPRDRPEDDVGAIGMIFLLIGRRRSAFVSG